MKPTRAEPLLEAAVAEVFKYFPGGTMAVNSDDASVVARPLVESAVCVLTIIGFVASFCWCLSPELIANKMFFAIVKWIGYSHEKPSTR